MVPDSCNLVIYECGICGSYHPWDWDDDCRDDKNRFASPEEYAESVNIAEEDIEVRTMAERVEHDQRGGASASCASDLGFRTFVLPIVWVSVEPPEREQR